mgnify:CR=1 FL=1
MDIIFFLGYGIRKETVMKKNIYNYLSKYGNIIFPDIDYNISIEENLNKLNLPKKKYILVAHSIGAYFVYKLMEMRPDIIKFSIIFDGSVTIKDYFTKELQPKKDYELLHNYSKDFYNLKKIKKPLYYFRNLDTINNEIWLKSCIKEAEKFEKNNPELFNIFYVINQGHNFYMNNKNYKTLKKILDMIFTSL